jgi:hypothetical protein
MLMFFVKSDAQKHIVQKTTKIWKLQQTKTLRGIMLIQQILHLPVGGLIVIPRYGGPKVMHQMVVLPQQ